MDSYSIVTSACIVLFVGNRWSVWVATIGQPPHSIIRGNNTNVNAFQPKSTPDPGLERASSSLLATTSRCCGVRHQSTNTRRHRRHTHVGY